jgi:hypothetical protein
MARLSRYSRWDGTQAVPDLDADELLSAMSDDLLAEGDLMNALRRLFQRGARDPQGGRMPGLQDLLKQLQQQRKQRLEQYDLGSMLDDIKKKLAEIRDTERQAIEKEVPPGAKQEQKLNALEQLPQDPAGQIKALQDYPFHSAEAKQKFDELMKSLQEQMLKPFMQGMQQGLQNLTPEDLQRMREMMRDLNKMLRERAEGGEPDFQSFKDKWGQNFPGAENLDQLLEQMGKQMGQMQSLMESLTPGQRQQLQEMMQSLFARDERLEAEMAQLAMNLEELLPMDAFRRPYDFKGDENVTMQEAMRVMEELQQMDQLERELRRAKDPGDLDDIKREDVERLLGEEAARDLERLKELAKKLEEAGYLESKGGRLQMTARAIRKIADKALRDVFSHLKRDRFGRHAVSRRGAGGDRTDDAKRYEFGDPFLLDLKQTLMNAVERGARHARAARSQRFRGVADGAVDPGRHRGPPRPEPLHALQRLLRACQEGRPRPPGPDSRPVPPRQAVHRGLLALRARVHSGGATPALAERHQHRHQHARGLHARPHPPRSAEGRQQAGHHDHRRRAHRPHGERGGGVLLSAHPPDAAGDAQGSAALHPRGHHHQHLHARPQRDVDGLRRADGPHQPRTRLLRHSGAPRRVRARDYVSNKRRAAS